MLKMASADESSSLLHWENLEGALQALESGGDVDHRSLNELARILKGDHECEITFEGGDGDNLEKLYNGCTKNPGHPTFIPVSDFKMEHLPPDYRTEKIMNSIQYWVNMTVKILVRYVSHGRPDNYPETDKPYPCSRIRGSKRVRRFGTGNIFGVALDDDLIKEEVCPCHVCEKLDFENREKEFWVILVETSKHVIYDALEAKRSVFECFYDSDSNKSETVKVLYGYGMNEQDSNIEEDLCQVTSVTHDKELVDRLKKLIADHSFSLIPQYRKSLGVLISHPHGCSKRITVGHVLHLIVPTGWDYPTGIPIPCDDAMACRLPAWSQMPDCHSDPLPKILPSSHTQCPENSSFDPELHGKSKNPLDEDPEEFSPKPGTQFLLPLGTTFTLPKDAKYAFRFPHQDSVYFSIAPGTKFTLRNGRTVFFPPEAEFFMYMFSARHSYVSYMVDSCEGSSGAALLQDGGGSILCCTYPHSGKDDITKDANRSGLQCYTILPESATSDDPVSHPAPIMPQYMRFEVLGE